MKRNITAMPKQFPNQHKQVAARWLDDRIDYGMPIMDRVVYSHKSKVLRRRGFNTIVIKEVK